MPYPRLFIAAAAAGAAALGEASSAAAAERLTVGRLADGRYSVVSSASGPLGRLGRVRGAGGAGHLEAARRAGADAIRTWGTETLGEDLKGAAAHGLRVSAGIWLPHAAARYQDCGDLDADPFWKAELAKYIADVRKYKRSSAILWWTVGNEIELETDPARGSECIWQRLEWVVKAIKREDPDHPVGTVLAGPHVPKVRLIAELVPSLDFLGVNAYGEESMVVGGNLLKAGFTKPYAIMEFGPSGHWLAPLTEWGAMIEESSSQKAPRYNATCHKCIDDPFCLGAFAFVWGWKWEKTGTWYGMFNEWPEVTRGVAVDCPQCESEVMDTVEMCWTGRHRRERPPTIKSVSVDGVPLTNLSFVVPRRKDVSLRVDAEHPLGRDMVAIWGVTDDRMSSAIGGAFEATKPLMTGLWPKDATTGTGLSVVIDTSRLPVSSEYRLYVFVRQDPAIVCAGSCRHQEASASLPFRICHAVVEGEVCHRHVRYAMEVGIKSHPDLYGGVGRDSSFEEVQMLLHQRGIGGCPPPCAVRVWCHTAQRGEECYGQVQWLMDRVQQEPQFYPKALWNASFEATQRYIQSKRDGTCPIPCPEGQAPPPEERPEDEEDVGETGGMEPAKTTEVPAAAAAARRGEEQAGGTIAKDVSPSSPQDAEPAEALPLSAAEPRAGPRRGRSARALALAVCAVALMAKSAVY